MKWIGRTKSILLLNIILCLLCGCAENEVADKEAASNSKGSEKVAVAEWQESSMTLKSNCRMMGDTLYYVDSEWDEENERQINTSICKRNRNAKEECIASFSEEEEFLCYTIDKKENVYCLYADHSENPSKYNLRKVSVTGEIIYDTSIMTQQEEEENNFKLREVFMSEVTEDGYVCCASLFGELYLFDGEGQLVSVSKLPWNEMPYNNSTYGLVNTGANDIFVYRIEDEKILLQKIKVENGELDVVRVVELDNESGATLELYNGYNKVFFISDSTTLWKYDTEAGKLERILGWGDRNVNLQDYTIECFGILPDETLYIMAYKSYEETAFVQVSYLEQSEIEEVQTITISSLKGSEYFNVKLEDAVASFNRSNNKYKAEIVSYSSRDELHLDLVKGEGTDIMVLGIHGVDSNILASKGILENLQPYFAESDAIQEDELLPAVRRAGTFGGELVCIFPTFKVSGLEVEKGTTMNGAWTSDDYLTLAETNPDAAMGDFGDPKYYKYYVMKNVMQADIESYVDWEKKKCFFDSEKFITILERVNQLNVPTTSNLADITAIDTKAVREKFLNKEILTDPYGFSSIEGVDISKENGGFGGFSEIVGFPNSQGIPYYNLEPTTPLGMNSASENKEGAWAFMEFILSEEYQLKLDTISVRQKLFDEHLKLKETHGGLVQIDLTDEERNFLAFMVENSYWIDGYIAREFNYIISEETDALWAGDKTAEEVADIIQSRISIFLSEQSE